MIRSFFKLSQRVFRVFQRKVIQTFLNGLSLYINEVKCPSDWKILGRIYIDNRNGIISFGKGFYANSGYIYNNIGRQQRVAFIVRKGELRIGQNLGISASTIVCHKSIEIGNSVMIGANCAIYDTDFHSIDPIRRKEEDEFSATIQKKPVKIESDVFIGAHCTILKGTHIGQGSVIGACSVIPGLKIPPGQIWAGNPAKFIRNID